MSPTTIHQPATCAASWDAMSPTDVGRHCASCQTQVVDFTRMTDGEVVAFLSQYSPERRCGRFREDQVDRTLLAAAQPVTGWRRWAMVTVLLLGSVSGIKARAQSTKLGQNPRAVQGVATSTSYVGIPDSLFLVCGVVRNRWGFRQPRAQVKVGGIRDTTDAVGHFQLLVPKSKFKRITWIHVLYWAPNYKRRLIANVSFDSTRTFPYRIKLGKQVLGQRIGFF